MSRSIGTNLKIHMQGETLTMAVCLLIVRADGQKYGFTLIDVPITYTLTTTPFDSYGAVVYTPYETFNPTSIRTSAGSGVDGLEVQGVISETTGISDDDLSVGEFEGATVLIFQVNYNSLADGEMIDYRGFIGEITIGDVIDILYKVEMRSLTSLQKGYTGDVLNPTCRIKRFCDGQCQLDEADFTYSVSIISVTDSVTITVGSNGLASGKFDFGIIRMTSGPNSGKEKEIKFSVLSGGNQILVLKEEFPWPLTNGQTCEIVEGCDRLPATCSGRYNNKINFRGEDMLPGTNKVNEIVTSPAASSVGS